MFADESWEVVYAAPSGVKRGVVLGTGIVIVYEKCIFNPVDSFYKSYA